LSLSTAVTVATPAAAPPERVRVAVPSAASALSSAARRVAVCSTFQFVGVKLRDEEAGSTVISVSPAVLETVTVTGDEGWEERRTRREPVPPSGTTVLGAET
jgi:hypothetical protein